MAKGIIVDDSKFMRKIIRESLESAGHEVLAEAENGYEGVDCYKKFKPDFVTMDITMGGKDGMKAVEEIAAFDPNAKVVIVSALSENTIKMNATTLNASAFINKPFAREDLLNAIKKIL